MNYQREAMPVSSGVQNLLEAQNCLSRLAAAGTTIGHSPSPSYYYSEEDSDENSENFDYDEKEEIPQSIITSTGDPALAAGDVIVSRDVSHIPPGRNGTHCNTHNMYSFNTAGGIPIPAPLSIQPHHHQYKFPPTTTPHHHTMGQPDHLEPSLVTTKSKVIKKRKERILTEEEQEEKRRINREEKRRSRACMTEDQKLKQRIRNTNSQRKYRAAMSEEKKQEQRRRNAETKRKSRLRAQQQKARLDAALQQVGPPPLGLGSPLVGPHPLLGSPHGSPRSPLITRPYTEIKLIKNIDLPDSDEFTPSTSL